jgi:hypothetical protein
MRRMVVQGLLGVSLAAAAGGCGTPVPAGYPEVRGPETAFDLVVDGEPGHDAGPTGALFIDVAPAHYLIPARSTIAVVPSLAVGSYVAPDPNVRMDPVLGFSYTVNSLRITIDGNQGGYVWGSLDGLLAKLSLGISSAPPVHVTGRFAAGIE